MKNEDENQIMNSFVALAAKLSPENLTCDGELSKNQVQARLRQIKAEWNKLENKLGRTMTEDEVWQWYVSKRQ